MNPLSGQSVTEKLARLNYATWRAQVLVTLRGECLQGYLTGAKAAPPAETGGKDAVGKDVKIPNPAWDEWYTSDQQVLGFLLTSVCKDVLGQIAAMETAAQAWKMIEDMFSSRTQARAVNTRLALATT